MWSMSHTAWACPDCPVARDARTMFFSVDFFTNLLVALSPFFVMLAVVFLLVRSISRRTGKGTADANED
jgi:hypothetical protein